MSIKAGMNVQHCWSFFLQPNYNVFCGLPGPQEKDDSAMQENLDLDLGYYFLTRGK